jgi:hypothetical protein
MGNIDPSDILRRLGPNYPVIGGLPQFVIYLLYIIFFLSLISLFSMPDKNIIPTILIAVVLMAAVIAKVDAVSNHCDFLSYVLNVSMFVLPFIAGGTIRSRQSKGRAVGPAIIAAIFGGVYFFAFWYFVQQHCATTPH